MEALGDREPLRAFLMQATLLPLGSITMLIRIYDRGEDIYDGLRRGS